jgi:hypothetical protein
LISCSLRPLLKILPKLNRPLNIGRLFALVATAQQQHSHFACHRVIDAVAWSPVDAQLPDSVTERFTVPQISGGQSVDPDKDLGGGSQIIEIGQPFPKDVLA